MTEIPMGQKSRASAVCLHVHVVLDESRIEKKDAAQTRLIEFYFVSSDLCTNICGYM